MTPLRLPPMRPEELPEVLLQWWLTPLSGWLLERHPKLQEVHLIGITENGPALRLQPGARARGWEASVVQAARVVLDAPPDALDDDPTLRRALPVYLPPRGEVRLATAHREATRGVFGDDRAFHVRAEWLAPAVAPPPPPPEQQPLDPEVEAELAGLEAMDAADELALELAAALRLLERGATDAARRRLERQVKRRR